jgi:hypothetical protein
MDARSRDLDNSQRRQTRQTEVMNTFSSLVEELKEIDGNEDPNNFVAPATRYRKK